MARTRCSSVSTQFGTGRYPHKKTNRYIPIYTYIHSFPQLEKRSATSSATIWMILLTFRQTSPEPNKRGTHQHIEHTNSIYARKHIRYNVLRGAASAPAVSDCRVQTNLKQNSCKLCTYLSMYIAKSTPSRQSILRRWRRLDE